jgi:2-dehydropantoate 2-reductase
MKRILIVGAGATGGYFGGRLAQAGRDVTFLVRPARAERLRADGLQIVSPNGDVTLQPQLVTAGHIAAAYDVVLLAVKAFALESALDDLAGAVGSDTLIVPVLNGIRHIDVLVERFGENAVLGGLCLIGATLDDRGRIVQLSPTADMSYGERGGGHSARIAALDELLQKAGFAARASARILPEMWEKWVMLATLGGITCLMRGTVGDVAGAPGGTAFAAAFLDECVAAAAACGYPQAEAFLARSRTGMTQAGSTLASSMYRDLQQGNNVEADQILGDLLERARGFGVATPLLATAFTHLKVYQGRLGSGAAS